MNLGWSELSDTEREREYSPSSCLPDGDYSPFIAAYANRSEAAWVEVEGRPDAWSGVVEYGPGEANTMHIAVPEGPTSPAVLVYIHGGYWQQLSSRDSLFAATACLDRGWAFAAVDYPLAPHASLDEIVACCCKAVTKISDDADELGIDANRIVVAGSSAGAHLSAMVAIKMAIDSSVELAGTVLVSGVFELEPLLGTTVNDAVGMDLDEAVRNSPMRRIAAGFPPSIDP